jgi:hypothetical protein
MTLKQTDVITSAHVLRRYTNNVGVATVSSAQGPTIIAMSLQLQKRHVAF